MSKIEFESIICNGYNKIEKIDYIEVFPSSISKIAEIIVNSYPNLLYIGKKINIDKQEALSSILQGHYLLEKELIISISHYNDFSTLEFSFSFESFESFLGNINSYLCALEKREHDLQDI